ncbi:hypothetical protein CPC08DRAFT_746541 [Agrocybe pediades]|nr:hypothetical protein CPC08DRAFT_746541 [Agrocybe pediades]
MELLGGKTHLWVLCYIVPIHRILARVRVRLENGRRPWSSKDAGLHWLMTYDCLYTTGAGDSNNPKYAYPVFCHYFKKHGSRACLLWEVRLASLFLVGYILPAAAASSAFSRPADLLSSWPRLSAPTVRLVWACSINVNKKAPPNWQELLQSLANSTEHVNFRSHSEQAFCPVPDATKVNTPDLFSVPSCRESEDLKILCISSLKFALEPPHEKCHCVSQVCGPSAQFMTADHALMQLPTNIEHKNVDETLLRGVKRCSSVGSLTTTFALEKLRIIPNQFRILKLEV